MGLSGLRLDGCGMQRLNSVYAMKRLCRGWRRLWKRMTKNIFRAWSFNLTPDVDYGIVGVEMSIKKEQGDKREFSTGAKRQNADRKPRPGLFPGDAYLAISQHFADGAAIYDDRNWEKGLPLSSIIDSLERHIAQEKMGLTDESHDLALAWNAVVYLATKLRIKNGILPAELDNMPRYTKAEEQPDYRAMGYCSECTKKLLAADVGGTIVELCQICGLS